MQKIFRVVLVLSIALTTRAQVCNSYNFGKDQKLTYEVRSFPLMFESDMSMITGDTKYKVKNSIAFNEKIASGKVQPKSTEQVVISFQRAEDMKDFRFYEANMTGMKTPVNMQYYCLKDTLATLLYFGHLAYVPNADTLGAFLFGMTYHNMNAKVGDRGKGSSNISLIFADNSQISKVRKLFYDPINTFEVSPAQFYEVTTNVTGPINATSYGITLLQPPLVLREEKMTVAGKEYNAKVIGSESWMKTMIAKMDMSFFEIEHKYLETPTLSKEIIKKPSFEPGGKRVYEKKSGEYVDMNKHGFILSYREEWIVQGLGVVKTVSYDSNGAILAISELKKIE